MRSFSFALESDEITEENEMSKFAIIDAVEKVKTARTGLQLYPWQDVDVGKGFFVLDEKDKKPMQGNQLARRQPMGWR